MSDRPTALLRTPGTDLAGAVAAPPVPNLRRIGGEMFAWSDRDPRRGPAVPDGALLRLLVRGLGGAGRTALVAGPHSDQLVEALTADGTQVTWLIRSLADAEHVARTHPGVTVLCGGAAYLDEATAFDLVVAADGFDRLNSVEGEQAPVSGLMDRLAGTLRPGGTLLLMHENLFGVHHTVRVEPGAREGHDSAWYPPGGWDSRRPASLPQLTDQLATGDLAVQAAYAAFGAPSAPTVLLGRHLLNDVASPLRPLFGAVVAAAYTEAFRGRPVLADPRRLMARALQAGAEGTVATAWVVVARRGDPADPPAGDQRDLLVGDATGTFAYAASVDGDRVRTAVLEPLPGDVVRAGLRRVVEPVAVSIGGGHLLEERLLHLCAVADLRLLRTELIRFDGWLREQAIDGTIAGPAALAGVADVLVGEDGLALLPTRWEPLAPIPVQTVATRAMWQFAVQLITAGRPHPWPVTAGAAELTVILLGILGRGSADGDLRAAVELTVAVQTAEQGLSLSEQRSRTLQLLAVTPGTAGTDVTGYLELTEALWRQRYQAGHLLAMMEWTEQIITSRDLWLSKLDWEVQFYRKGWAGRFLMAGRAVYQTAKRDGRRVARTVVRKLRGGGRPADPH